MERRSLKVGGDRYGKRKNRARPDRIIEKRPSWQDYLDPEEDPGLVDEEEPAGVDETEPAGLDEEAAGEEEPGNTGEKPDQKDSK